MITIRDIKMILAVLLLVAAFFAVRSCIATRDQNKQNEQDLAQSVNTSAAAVDIAEKTDDALATRHDTEVEVKQIRVLIQQQQETLRREDKTINEWSNGVIPSRLRDADRAARTAGIGSGNIQSGTEADSGAEKN